MTTPSAAWLLRRPSADLASRARARARGGWSVRLGCQIRRNVGRPQITSALPSTEADASAIPPIVTLGLLSSPLRPLHNRKQWSRPSHSRGPRTLGWALARLRRLPHETCGHANVQRTYGRDDGWKECMGCKAYR